MKIAANQPRNATTKWPMSSESVHPVRLVSKKRLIVAKHAQPTPAQTPNLAARATRSDICVSSLTFDMSGRRRQAKPAVGCPLDGGVRLHARACLRDAGREGTEPV